MVQTKDCTVPAVVFWDWNGTLCDDLQVSLDAVNELLRLKGRPPISLEQYYSYVDTPISKFYEHLFDLEEVTMEEIAGHYQSYYNTHLSDNCLMEGMLPVLKALKDAGAMQVILSSTHRESIEKRVKRLGIQDFFTAILAAEDWFAYSKEDRALSFLKQSGYGRDLSRVWFVGDAVHDSDVAKSCGCGERCILIPFGHQGMDELTKTGSVICTDLSRIPELITNKVGLK